MGLFRIMLAALAVAGSTLRPLVPAGSAIAAPSASSLRLADFLPRDFVRDGSVSYEQEVQLAIDTAAEKSMVLDFPAMTLRVTQKG